jgi:hypothetical protein
MIQTSYPHININVRLHRICSLIFFAFIIIAACKRGTTKSSEIVWDNNSAVAISIPNGALKGNVDNSFENRLKVYVDQNKSTPMLGEYSLEEDKVIFKPLVPLTRGLSYEVYFDDKLVSRIEVPLANASDAPKLLMIYPTIDTLPENLLKLYLQFSRPMREGESQKHIALTDGNNNIVPGVFLDLQPELWNKERTVLTIWLDPGRIKRDLIPNQQLGNPLKKGQTYTLSVSQEWKDAQGLPFQKVYSKQFVVSVRDSVMPSIEDFRLNVPTAQSKKPLEIKLDEALDYFLLQESIEIVDKANKKVAGKIQVGDKERDVQFIPNSNWQAGSYKVHIDPVLEDLAGNNLTRPFDRDMQMKNVNAGRTKFEITFQIQ